MYHHVLPCHVHIVSIQKCLSTPQFWLRLDRWKLKIALLTSPISGQLWGAGHSRPPHTPRFHICSQHHVFVSPCQLISPASLNLHFQIMWNDSWSTFAFFNLWIIPHEKFEKCYAIPQATVTWDPNPPAARRASLLAHFTIINGIPDITYRCTNRNRDFQINLGFKKISRTAKD